MAGPAHRGSRGRGRSPRASLAAPSRAAVPGVATGATVDRPTTVRTPDPDPARRAADRLITGATYRRLLLGGLTPGEAATLTAFLCGIPIAEVHWSLRQVNHLLFLRELARTGRFGARDGEPVRPH